jgi:hypothetical protein
VIHSEPATALGSRRLARRILILSSFLAPIAFFASCLLGVEIASGPVSERHLFDWNWDRPLLTVIAAVVALILAGVVLGWKLRVRRPRAATASATASLACSTIILVPMFVGSLLSAI